MADPTTVPVSLGDLGVIQVPTSPGAVAAMGVANTARADVATLAATVAALQTLANNVTDLSASSIADRAQLNTRVAALEARTTALEAKALTLQSVTTTTPALLLGGNADVVITWPTPFAAADYAVTTSVQVTGVTVGKVTAAIKAGTKTKTGVTVTVASVGLAIGAGQTLDVVGIRLG